MTGDFQRGDTIFPMAMRQDWLTDNFTIFDFTIDSDDMATIDGLDRGCGRLRPHPNDYND